MWVQIVIMIVALILSYALAPKPPIPKPPALTDFEVPVAEEGGNVPWLFGEGWMKGYNVLWYGDLGLIPVKSKGKK